MSCFDGEMVNQAPHLRVSQISSSLLYQNKPIRSSPTLLGLNDGKAHSQHSIGGEVWKICFTLVSFGVSHHPMCERRQTFSFVSRTQLIYLILMKWRQQNSTLNPSYAANGSFLLVWSKATVVFDELGPEFEVQEDDQSDNNVEEEHPYYLTSRWTSYYT